MDYHLKVGGREWLKYSIPDPGFGVYDQHYLISIIVYLFFVCLGCIKVIVQNKFHVNLGIGLLLIALSVNKHVLTNFE